VPESLSGATSMTPLLLSGVLAQLDVFSGSQVCGSSHGTGVGGFLQQGGQLPLAYDLSQLQRGTNQPALSDGLFALASGSDVGAAMERMAQGSKDRGQKLVLNLSLQAHGQPNDGQDRSICETSPNDSRFPQCSAVLRNGVWVNNGGNDASWKTDEFSFLVGIAGELHYMPPDLRDNTLIVVSAGNSGLDLTREIDLLQTLLPNAGPHMIVVGATDASTKRFNGYNHSSNPAGMLYAPGVGTTLSQTGSCPYNGTSFAAPRVASLAAQLAVESPNLTTAQIVQAIMNASPIVEGMRTLPSPEQVRAYIRSPNILTLTPVSLRFTASQGANPAAQTLTASSTRGAAVWAHSSVSWTGLSWSGAVLNVSVNVAGLAQRTYSGVVTAYGAGVTPATVSVTLVVNTQQFTLTVTTAGTGSGTGDNCAPVAGTFGPANITRALPCSAERNTASLPTATWIQ
jgi:hypothetical protein